MSLSVLIMHAADPHAQNPQLRILSKAGLGLPFGLPGFQVLSTQILPIS